MHDEESLSFNFWPAFADMMLALVLVLVVCIALFMASAFRDRGVDFTQVAERQKRVVDAIAREYSVKAAQPTKDRYELYIGNDAEPAIVFRNDLKVQRITFSEQILFDQGYATLKRGGEEAIMRVGGRLKEQIGAIDEIQIEGHADTAPTDPEIEVVTRHSIVRVPSSNLLLAARRSITVFEVMQKKVKIDPATHRMSITSFGEYMSVQRSEGQADYNQQKVDADNSDDDKMRRNRRIELVVTYRR